MYVGVRLRAPSRACFHAGMRRQHSVLVALVTLMAACSADTENAKGRGPGSNGGTDPFGNAPEGGSSGGDFGNTDGTSSPMGPGATVDGGGGGECGSSEYSITDVPPNLMILLDRSCSMPKCDVYPGTAWIPLHPCFTGAIIPGVGTQTDKWGAAVQALNQLTMTFPDQLQWGLQFYPDATGDACMLDAPSVVPAAGTAVQIQTVLTNGLMNTDPNFPNGPCNTMTSGALEAMAASPSLMATDRKNFVLLITDGAEFGCNFDPNKAEQVVAQMLTADVPTFVVGFGGDVNPAALDKLAIAGGKPNPAAPPSYYQADDQAALEAALGKIVASVVGCDFALDKAPPNTKELYAFLNNKPVTRDDPDGWVYDAAANKVTFQGTSCTALQDGSATDIDITFGCPQPTVD